MIVLDLYSQQHYTFIFEGNKHKWVPLHLDDMKPDNQERPGSQNSSRSQPETSKLVPHNNRRNEAKTSMSLKILVVYLAYVVDA